MGPCLFVFFFKSLITLNMLKCMEADKVSVKHFFSRYKSCTSKQVTFWPNILVFGPCFVSCPDKLATCMERKNIGYISYKHIYIYIASLHASVICVLCKISISHETDHVQQRIISIIVQIFAFSKQYLQQIQNCWFRIYYLSIQQQIQNC